MSDLTAVVPCDDCLSPVIWAVDSGTQLQVPVDAVPVYGGNVALEISANRFPIAHSEPMAHTFAQNRTDLRMAHKATCAGTPVRPKAHAFALDERVPADFHGRTWCICGLPGRAGDERHPLDAPPLRPPTDQTVVLEAARARDAAVLGEREDPDADLLALARRVFHQADPPPADLAGRIVADLHGRVTAS